MPETAFIALSVIVAVCVLAAITVLLVLLNK